MLNQEDYVKVLDLHRQGWTKKEIAAELGYHPATIAKWLRSEGPPTRREVPDDAPVLRPGGVAVWSHIDFDGLILNTTDKDLGRRVITAFADHALSWMRHTDGRMGRRLPGLVHTSRLELADAHIHTTVATRLEGDAAARGERHRQHPRPSITTQQLARNRRRHTALGSRRPYR